MAQLLSNLNVAGNNRTTIEGSSDHSPGTPIHTNTRETNNKNSMLLRPQFINNQVTTTPKATKSNKLFDDYFQEYATLEENTRATLTFQEYSNIKF